MDNFYRSKMYAVLGSTLTISGGAVVYQGITNLSANPRTAIATITAGLAGIVAGTITAIPFIKNKFFSKREENTQNNNT